MNVDCLTDYTSTHQATLYRLQGVAVSVGVSVGVSVAVGVGVCDFVGVAVGLVSVRCVTSGLTHKP